MFITHSFIVLCASLLAQGAIVAPSGFAAPPAAMTPASAPTAALDGALPQPFSTEGPFDGDADRHPAPNPLPVPLPAPIFPPACPGPGTGSGSGGNTGSGTSSSQVIIVVHTITTASDSLNTALSGLTTSLQLADVTSISKVLIQGFTTIVANLAKAVATFPFTPPFGSSVSGTVVDALIGFVRVHQALLATVIGKHSIFAQFGLTAPIAAVLRTVEAGVDTFAFQLINLIPDKRNTVQAQINSLDLTLKTSINTYTQICFPSKGYPQTKPTCVKVN
ncbi:hypothetical protein D9619_013315 [Psilocybe cf. subviscida]|uniref:Uncharacterized protein n=1 Tax=Psilocybe cf. subviscida TaxID=2480587 RepID=A0A8H5BSE0_9AGAR|nr:hypothetical protein D9619_013315 [Psilocybe cf. subviscida]